MMATENVQLLVMFCRSFSFDFSCSYFDPPALSDRNMNYFEQARKAYGSRAVRNIQDWRKKTAKSYLSGTFLVSDFLIV